MGLFSFGNKDAKPAVRERPSAGAGAGRRERRGERRSGQEAMLDPTLPEKQRARRRLVGAVALVLAAVVILPMVLDSHPRPVTSDIAVDVPSRPSGHARVANLNRGTAAGTALPHDPSDSVPAANAQTGGTHGAASADAGLASAPAVATRTQRNDTAASAGSAASGRALAHGGNTAAAPERSAAARSASSSAAPERGTAARSVNTAASDRSAAPHAASQDPTPAAPPERAGAPTSRFVVQLGAFKNEANARAWVARLKAANITAYIEHQKQDDGTVRTLVRAGPFVDRASAEAAVRKVRDAGLAASSKD